MIRTSVRTFTGSEVNLLRPDLESIDIEDIAHHLSKLDRYNGAGSFPYSVGHHSLLVASILPAELRLWGLLHDATEAYLGDVVAPLKNLLPVASSLKESLFTELEYVQNVFPEAEPALRCLRGRVNQFRDIFRGYRDVENNLTESIAERFRLPMPRPRAIKDADRAVMVAEMRQVMNWPDLADAQRIVAAPVRIYERSWQNIREEFLRKFAEYGGVV